MYYFFLHLVPKLKENASFSHSVVIFARRSVEKKNKIGRSFEGEVNNFNHGLSFYLGLSAFLRPISFLGASSYLRWRWYIITWRHPYPCGFSQNSENPRGSPPFNQFHCHFKKWYKKIIRRAYRCCYRERVKTSLTPSLDTISLVDITNFIRYSFCDTEYTILLLTVFSNIICARILWFNLLEIKTISLATNKFRHLQACTHTHISRQRACLHTWLC